MILQLKVKTSISTLVKKIDHKVLTFVQEEMIMYEKAVSAENAPVKLYHGASILGLKFWHFIYIKSFRKQISNSFL